MTEILGGGGYNLGSGKQLLTIKVSFCINRPGSRGFMTVLATRSLLGRLTFMTSYHKNGAAIYLKFFIFHDDANN